MSKSKYNRNYAPYEDSILIKNYKDMTYKEIGNMIGRTEFSVQRRLAKLGLRKQKKPYNTPESTSILSYQESPYYETEEEMMNGPTYEAKNRHLMKPLQENWKLF